MKSTYNLQFAQELNAVHCNDEEAEKALAKAIRDEIDREIMLEIIKTFPPENEDDEFESLVSIAKDKD